jgi:hypothetical protein
VALEGLLLLLAVMAATPVGVWSCKVVRERVVLAVRCHWLLGVAPVGSAGPVNWDRQRAA